MSSGLRGRFGRSPVRDGEPRDGTAPSDVAPVRIRRMRGADLAGVLDIERRSFGSPWSERTFRTLLRRRNARSIVAEDGAGEVAGYAVVWYSGSEAELGNLAVEPERRRRGVATALLREVLRGVRSRGLERLFLEVRKGNEAARRLYERQGFQVVGVRPGYYVNPREDALVMRRVVPADGA